MTATAKTEARGPLAGIRIVEFEAIGPLPLAAMILADMGADVVRITRPRTGNEAWDDVGGAVLHRSRASVELNLKTQSAEALAMIAQADVVLEGLRPGVMERLGLGPETCLATNPRLVYGRMTGWGQSGPLAPRAGHDINYIALTGALAALGKPGEAPPVPLNLVGDYGGGTMFLVTGVLAALLSAKTSGRGQVVDAAIVDGVATMSALFHSFLATGMWSPRRADNMLDGAAPFYRCYLCADGGYMAVGSLEPQFFHLLLTGLDIDPATIVQHDRATWPEMERLFAERFASKTRAEWEEVFSHTDACVTPVLDWSEALTGDHLAARGTFTTQDGIAQPTPAPRFSETPAAITPERAETTAQVLARWTTE